MNFGVVNKSTVMNRFVLHTLQHKITHLAVITRKTNIKLGILKVGKLEKSRNTFFTSQTAKIKIEREHIFLKKKISKTYMRVLSTFINLSNILEKESNATKHFYIQVEIFLSEFSERSEIVSQDA